LKFRLGLWGLHFEMNDIDLAKCLHSARKTLLAIHKRDSEALRRKPRPDELVASAKLWAERLLDVATINPGPAKLRSSSDFSGKAGGPAIYAEEIAAAESILAIIAELKHPMAILMAFQKAFPEFEGVKCVLPYIRTVIGKNGRDLYFLYRRQSVKPAWERMLPSDPTSAEFMDAYKQAERDFEARTRNYYFREPATQTLAAA
jgi:hypothetical protein